MAPSVTMSTSFSSAMPRGVSDHDTHADLTSIGWHGLLNECMEPPEVVRTVKEYLARWSPEEIAALPEHCRPGRLVDGDDVADYALRLVRAQCAGASADLDKLAAFVTSAALRLAQITARTSEVSSEHRGEH
jgi:hypothetical protein